MGIQRATPLEVAQQIRIFNRKLRMEPALNDVFTYSQATIKSTDKNRVISDAIYLKLEPGSSDGRFVNVPMMTDLTGEPVEGTTTSQVGRERRLNTKYCEAFSTDVSQAVTLEEYGLEALTKAPYQINEQAVKQLGKYKAEIMGRYHRQTLLESYSYNLNNTPHNLALMFSPNIFVAGATFAQQPRFANEPQRVGATVGASPTAAGWATQIATALINNGGAAATLRMLLQIEEYVSTHKYIPALSVGGASRYILLLPSNQCTYLKDPTVIGSMGDIFVERSCLNEAEMNFPNVLGRVGRLLIVEDERYPTLTVTGSAGNYGLTAQYRAPGRGANSDPRDHTQNGYDVGFVLGPECIIDKTDEDWHLEYQWEEYDKFYATGIFATLGMSMPLYKNGSITTATNIQQDSSCAIIFGKPPADWV